MEYIYAIVSGSNFYGWGGGGAVTIADGADSAEGSTTDIAVTGDSSGTISAKIRGLSKILFSVWDSVNGRLKVDGSSVTQPVSIASSVTVAQSVAANLNATVSGTVSANQSGTWTVQQGTPPWSIKPDGTIWSLTGSSANVNLTNTSISVTQSGNWTVQPITFASAQPVTGTFWQTTQPVSFAGQSVGLSQYTPETSNSDLVPSLPIYSSDLSELVEQLGTVISLLRMNNFLLQEIGGSQVRGEVSEDEFMERD